MFILKRVKVLCFDTLLEVFILKGLRWLQNRAKLALILKNLAAIILRAVGCSRSVFVEKKKEKYNAETQRAQRIRREEWDGVNRASWRLTIKYHGSTNVMQLSSIY